MLARTNKIIKDALRAPLTGISKPEPLKYHLPGACSRRIDDEHHLVYLTMDPLAAVSHTHPHRPDRELGRPPHGGRGTAAHARRPGGNSDAYRTVHMAVDERRPD
ncbi:Txe/YoeB family addiction module toxin [Streptomyces gamaensis]|uniref:Endoribonuclease YoeB n=1 Tax=Streptomyces gamaensis TaxID=1763542 RepID=A0ABW0ZEV0_9ACTN